MDGVDSSTSPLGVLVLHGFTGAPSSMRPLSDAFAAAGFLVDTPLLPGHGTTPDDLDTTRFDDWSSCADERFEMLTRRCDAVCVVGLSMGGTLSCWLAERHREIVGLVLVNPLLQPVDPSFIALLDAAIATGSTRIPSIGTDIRAPEHPATGGYDETPIRPLRSLVAAVDDLACRLGSITAPVLLFSSAVDHVVPVSTGPFVVDAMGGSVERVVLEASYHVATVDNDSDELVRRALEFVTKLIP